MGLAFYYTYNETKNTLHTQISDELMTTASIASMEISGDDLATLQAGDENTPEFIAIRDKLRSIRDSNPNIKYIYTMRRAGNNVEFVVDADYGEDADAAAIGDECSSVTDTMLGAFTSPCAEKEFTTDEWGTVLSGFAPVKDSSGNVVGIIGVDMSADTVLQKENSLGYVIIAIMAASIIIGTVIVVFISRAMIHDLEELNKVAHKISNGDTDVKPDIKRKDEIGELADDITRMAANIKDRINYNESVLRSISDPLYVLDNNGKITFFNEAAAKLTGYDANEVTGKTCYNVLNTPLCLSIKDGKKFWINDNGVKEFETSFKTRGGRDIVIRGSSAPLMDASGKVTGAIEIFRDITKEKEAEAEIRKAHEDALEKAAFSKSLLSSIIDGHIVVDTSGRITYINEIAQNYLGYSEAEAIGRHYNDIFRLQSNIIKDALRSGTSLKNIDDLLQVRSGKQNPVRVNIVQMKDASGRIMGLSITARDITRQKQTQENLKSVIRGANDIAGRVSKVSAQVSSSTNQAMAASRQISESIQQISLGSQNQAKQIDDISRLIRDVSSESASISKGAMDASRMLKEASQSAQSGSESARVAISKMGDIQRSVNDSAAIVKDLGEKSKQIGKIVDVITSIASQTNLLALNAAIEAARAGEAGRGFAVVAEEVRKLAEESARSAEQISELVSQIKAQTDNAVRSMDNGTAEVSSGSEIVGNALKSIEDISKSVNQTNAIASEFVIMTEKQVHDIDEIVKSIEQISAIVEESAASTEEVSASAEESTSTMEEIANMAQQLSKIVEEMKTEIQMIKVE